MSTPGVTANGNAAAENGSQTTAGGNVANATSEVSPLTSPIVSFSDGRAVDIAGYEDHSLAVSGAQRGHLRRLQRLC